MIDSTGLKAFGEGEWKVKKHGKERRRIWRKLHLAVDASRHEAICADLSLNNVTDAEAFPGLIRQTHRKIRSAAADGAYDTQRCHDELRRKKISALIPPRKGAATGRVWEQPCETLQQRSRITMKTTRPARWDITLRENTGGCGHR